MANIGILPLKPRPRILPNPTIPLTLTRQQNSLHFLPQPTLPAPIPSIKPAQNIRILPNPQYQNIHVTNMQIFKDMFQFQELGITIFCIRKISYT